MSFDDSLERAQADGRITTGDADEVRHFAGFLAELTAAGVPPRAADRTRTQGADFMRIWAEHYPEDYARAVAEERARRAAAARGITRHPTPMGYGHPTTSPGSPAGPDLEEDTDT